MDEAFFLFLYLSYFVLKYSKLLKQQEVHGKE